MALLQNGLHHYPRKAIVGIKQASVFVNPCSNNVRLNVFRRFSHPFGIGNGIRRFDVVNNPKIRAVDFDAQWSPLHH
jgi:hypothetical protein